jgi:hypothetical protein
VTISSYFFLDICGSVSALEIGLELGVGDLFVTKQDVSLDLACLWNAWLCFMLERCDFAAA